MQGKLERNTGWKWAIAAAATFFSITLILILNRHLTFYSDYDQGIFNQVFWNNLHGRLFQSSLSSQLSTNVVHSGEAPEVFYRRLGQHFTPALLIWWPIYALFPNPATLSVLQVTLVTAAGLVLFALARHYLEPPVAVAIAISYYCSNAVLGPTLANFHDICQLPLYVFGLLLAMEKRCWWLFALLCCCTVVVREDSGVVLFGVGVYMLASRRFPRIGLAVCLGSFFYVLLVTSQLMPMFSEDVSKRFLQERFGQYLTFLGDRIDEATIYDVMYGVLRQPWRFVAEIFSPHRNIYSLPPGSILTACTHPYPGPRILADGRTTTATDIGSQRIGAVPQYSLRHDGGAGNVLRRYPVVVGTRLQGFLATRGAA